MKFQSVESRVYPTLALTLNAGDVVDLPADTDVAGLVKADNKNNAAPVVDDAAPVNGKVSE